MGEIFCLCEDSDFAVCFECCQALCGDAPVLRHVANFATAATLFLLREIARSYLCSTYSGSDVVGGLSLTRYDTEVILLLCDILAFLLCTDGAAPS